MSEDITNIRKNIRQILRRANSMGSEENEDGTLKEYHEHRRKFLTYRNKFEKAEHVEAKEKKPFIPDWVKSGESKPLPISYKLKGSEVTDIRSDLTQDEETFGLGPGSIQRSSSFAATSGHERKRDYIRQFSKDNFSYLKGLYEKNQTEGSSARVQSTLDIHGRAVRSSGSQQQPKSVSRFKSLRRSSSVTPPDSPTYETASWNIEKNESTEVTTVITNMRNKFLESLWEDNDQREQAGNPGYYSLPANYAESMRASRKNTRIPKSQIPDLIIDPIKWDHMKVRDNRFLMAELSTPEFRTYEPRTPELQESPRRFTVKIRPSDEVTSSNFVSWDHGARVKETAVVGEDTVDEEKVETTSKEDITVLKMQKTDDAALDELCERLLEDMAVTDDSEKSTDKVIHGESSKDKESRQKVSGNVLTIEKKQTEFKSRIPLRIPALLKTKFSSKITRPNISEPSNSAVSISKVVNPSERKSRSPVNSIVKEPMGSDKSILVSDSTFQKTTKIPKHNGNKTPVKTPASTKN